MRIVSCPASLAQPHFVLKASGKEVVFQDFFTPSGSLPYDTGICQFERHWL